MKKIVLMALCLGIFSCKSLNYEDLNTNKSQNENLLKTIEPIVNHSRLEEVYSAGSYNSYSNTNSGAYANSQSNNVYAFGNQYTSTVSSYSKDVRVKDAVRIFDKEVKENIIELEGENRGYIILSLGYRGNDSSVALPIFSGLSLYTFNLLGMPNDNIKQSLEVEVEIRDLKNNRIKRYTETVLDSDYVALYYGYHPDTIYRKLAANNIITALQKIRVKINKDASEINKKL